MGGHGVACVKPARAISREPFDYWHAVLTALVLTVVQSWVMMVVVRMGAQQSAP